ncbi:MAG: hypothetical protein RL020_1887 [Pseudomonadota bacterium]
MIRLIVVLLVVCSVAQAQPVETQTPAWHIGKNIYQRGHANKPACATCHGIAGEGTQEGGQRAPPLTWQWLSHAQTQFGRARPAYNATEFNRAVETGVDVSGKSLSSVMPKYPLNDIELASLQNYLSIIGSASDTQEGVSDATLLIGAALPLSGKLQSVGEIIQRELTQVFDQLNQEGGLYGRRVHLVVRDSRSEGAGELSATQALVEQDRVLLLVGSFLTPSSGVEAWLQQQTIPLIGPVTLSSLNQEKNTNIFYLLPSMADQGRVLAEHALTSSDTGPSCKHVATWVEDEPYARNAMQGAQAQLLSQGVENSSAILFKQNNLANLALEPAHKKNLTDCVLFFGAAEQMALLAKNIPVDVRWFGLVALLGRGASDLPKSMTQNLFAAQPVTDEAISHGPFVLLARTAAQLSTEVLKRSGRDTSRAKVVAQLKALKDFRLPGLPPLTFGSQRRNGLQGAAIMKWHNDSQTYTLYKAWREVR